MGRTWFPALYPATKARPSLRRRDSWVPSPDPRLRVQIEIDQSTTEGTIPEMLPDRPDFYPEASLCSVALVCGVLGAEGMNTEILDASRTILSCTGGFIRHEGGHFRNSKQPPPLSYSDLRPTGPQKSIVT